MRTVFGDSPAAVIVRNPKEESFVRDYNEKLKKENRPAVLVAHDINEAQARLKDWVGHLGGTHPGAYTPWGVVKSTEPLAESLKQAAQGQPYARDHRPFPPLRRSFRPRFPGLPAQSPIPVREVRLSAGTLEEPRGLFHRPCTKISRPFVLSSIAMSVKC